MYCLSVGNCISPIQCTPVDLQKMVFLTKNDNKLFSLITILTYIFGKREN